MKKLLVLVFVAAMCLPAYGEILVYKFTCSCNPWIGFTDSNWTAGTVGTKQINGYCVLDVNMATGDLNPDPTLIFYGKDGKDKWGTSFDLSVAGDQIYFTIFDIVGTTNGGIYVYTEENDDQDRVGNIVSNLYGKIAYVDIGKGPKDKKYLPTSLKGTVEFWGEAAGNFEAFGAVTVTLDSKYTKPANKPGEEATQADTVTKIIDNLYNDGKGYLFP